MLFRLFALLGEIGRVAPCGGEAHVALASPAPFGYELFIAVAEHIADDRFALVVPDYGADGNLYDDVGAALAGAPVCAAAFAVARHIFIGKAEGQQIVHRPVGKQIDVAALAAVTAVGAAGGLALEGLERIHSVAAVARFDCYADFVRKYVFIYHVYLYRSRKFCRPSINSPLSAAEAMRSVRAV